MLRFPHFFIPVSLIHLHQCAGTKMAFLIFICRPLWLQLLLSCFFFQQARAHYITLNWYYFPHLKKMNHDDKKESEQTNYWNPADRWQKKSKILRRRRTFAKWLFNFLSRTHGQRLIATRSGKGFTQDKIQSLCFCMFQHTKQQQMCKNNKICDSTYSKKC